MADVITGLYDFTLPEVGASDDTWGTKLNANWQKMETLLAAAFVNGTPSTLGHGFRLDAAGANIPDISPVNVLDVSAQILRIGRSSAVGNLSVHLLDPGTTTIRVRLDSAGTGKVTTGIGQFGDLYIGASPTGTASTSMISAATGSTLYFRSGVDISQMIQFRNAANTVVAYIDLPGTVMASAAAIVTQEKGDARYLKLSAGTPDPITGALVIESTTPQLQWRESDQVLPAGQFRILGTAGLFRIERNTAAAGGFTTSAIVATFDPEGTAVVATTGVITKEKGDARYVNLAASGVANAAPVRIGDIYIGGSPAGAAATTAVSAATGSTLTLRGGIDTSNMVQITDSANVRVARFDIRGTGLGSDDTVVTKEKGDARYVNLAGGSLGVMTGMLTAPSATIGAFEINLQAGCIRRDGGMLYDSNASGGYHRHYIQNVKVTEVLAAGFNVTGALDVSGNIYAPRVDAALHTAGGASVILAPNVGSSIDGLVRLRPNGSGSTTASLAIGVVNSSPSLRHESATSGVICYFENSALLAVARVDGTGGSSIGGATTVITREKGDGRYTQSSSRRFKENYAPRSQASLLSVFDALVASGWIWGGETPETDERYGMPGVGFGAEDVEPVFPEAVRYQWVAVPEGEVETEKRVHGLDPMAMLAVLWAKIKQQETRLAELEAA